MIKHFTSAQNSSRDALHSLAMEGLTPLLLLSDFDVVEELENFRHWRRCTQDESAMGDTLLDGSALRENISNGRAQLSRPDVSARRSQQPAFKQQACSSKIDSDYPDCMTSSDPRSSSSLSSSAGQPTQSPPSLRSQAVEPKSDPPEAEALDGGWTGNVFPWIAVLGLCAASAGIGVAFSWLTTPAIQPESEFADSPSPVASDSTSIAIPLEELPLIPLSPTETAQVRDSSLSALDTVASGGSTVSTAALSSEASVTTVSLEEGDTTEDIDAVESERVESTNVATAASNSLQDSNLGPNLGAGTYLVLMTYQDDASLVRARQFAGDAFLKQVEGETYIQVAAFDQLEYARHMVDSLRNQGIPALVLQ